MVKSRSKDEVEVSQVSVEAVVGGVLMRLNFNGPVNPAQIGEYLKEVDENAKWRDDFPKKFGGSRDTKEAKCLVMNIDNRGDSKYVNLTCEANDDTVSVAVSKKVIDTFYADVTKLDVLSEANQEKFTKVWENAGNKPIMLTEDEQFSVKYYDIDGKCYLDSVCVTAGAEPIAEEKKEEKSAEGSKSRRDF